MFKLTEEQVNYIVEVYGGSESIIRDIERRLNLLAIPMDEDDYYEIVASVAAQKETIINKVRSCTRRDDAIKAWVSTDRLIRFALEEKYTDLSRISPEAGAALKSLH